MTQSMTDLGSDSWDPGQENMTAMGDGEGPSRSTPVESALIDLFHYSQKEPCLGEVRVEGQQHDA